MCDRRWEGRDSSSWLSQPGPAVYLYICYFDPIVSHWYVVTEREVLQPPSDLECLRLGPGYPLMSLSSSDQRIVGFECPAVGCNEANRVKLSSKVLIVRKMS